MVCNNVNLSFNPRNNRFFIVALKSFTNLGLHDLNRVRESCKKPKPDEDHLYKLSSEEDFMKLSDTYLMKEYGLDKTIINYFLRNQAYDNEIYGGRDPMCKYKVDW